LSPQSAGQGNKQRHIGSLKSKPPPALARRPTIDRVRHQFQHKCLRDRGYVFEDFLSEAEQLAWHLMQVTVISSRYPVEFRHQFPDMLARHRRDLQL
jgi:hypothetical protein